MTAADTADTGPVCPAYEPVTVNVTGVPLASPVTVTGDTPELDAVCPVDAVIVYTVPLVSPGAYVYETAACALPAVAVTPVGRPGTVDAATGAVIVTGADAADLTPDPADETPMTVNVSGTS